MAATITIYDVVEHYAGESPEPFGDYHHRGATPVARGDVILLRWRDSTPAYLVRVELIKDGTLHVMHAPDAAAPTNHQEAAP